jgi:hypothetical protein
MDVISYGHVNVVWTLLFQIYAYTVSCVKEKIM